MEIKISTKSVLLFLTIIAWIIFVGLSIDAAGTFTNMIYTLAINPDLAGRFWQGLDLSALYNYDSGHFFALTFIMSIAGILKSILFYVITRILDYKKLDFSAPFVERLGKFMFLACYLSLAIGFFARYGVKYASFIVQKGIILPDVVKLNLDGGDVWLFMGVTLFIIAQIFKRGIEIQSEHELTV